MTREQLKQQAQEFIANPNLMVTEGFGYKWLVDLIAKQDAFIDSLEDTLRRKEVESNRWRELCMQNSNLDNSAIFRAPKQG